MLKVIQLIRKFTCSLKAWNNSFLIVLLVTTNFHTNYALADEHSYTNAYVKAAYIFKLTEFVEWPSSQKTNKICVLGSDVIGLALAQIQRSSKDLEKWDIIPKYITSSFEDCQVLFLSNQEGENTEQILFTVKNKPILTVSDKQNFIENGGVVGFVINNNKIKLEINEAQSKKQDVQLSSKLMNVSVRTIR